MGEKKQEKWVEVENQASVNITHLKALTLEPGKCLPEPSFTKFFRSNYQSAGNMQYIKQIKWYEVQKLF